MIHWNARFGAVLFFFVLTASSGFGAGAVETDDGLLARYRTSSGQMLSLMNWKDEVALRPSEDSDPLAAFHVIDAAKPERSAPIRLERTNVESKSPLLYECESKEAAVKLNVEIESDYAAIRYRVEVEDLTGEDRALTIRYEIPVEAQEWLWWDDVAHSRTIRGTKRYVRYGRGDKGRYPVSWLPLGTISQPEGPHALTLAVPMDRPVPARVGYDGDFFIEVDIGLSPAALKSPGRAWFSFVLYSSDPAWGFRASLRKYYELFPKSFVKRVNREGLWLARTPTTALKNPADFAIGFHQVSSVMVSPLHYDNAGGIYTFLYDEPSRLNFTIHSEKKPTKEEVLRIIEAAANDPADPEHDNAKAILRNASQTPDGGFTFYIMSRGWRGHMIYFEGNLDPDMAYEGGPDGPSRLDLWWDRAEPIVMGVREGRTDGVYIDSAEGWIKSIDFNRDHFQYADLPLAWEPKEGRVGILTGVSRFEYLRATEQMMRERGKLFMGNLMARVYGIFAPLFDVLGSETPVDNSEWVQVYRDKVAEPGGKQWLMDLGMTEKEIRTATAKNKKSLDEKVAAAKADNKPWQSHYARHSWRSEEAMYYRRALAFQKPFSLLLKMPSKLAFRAFGVERMREYVDFSLFFGIYPSGPLVLFESDPEVAELYRRATPIARDLGSAGWEPITHARSSDEAVRIERFGYGPQNSLHFTVRNFGETQTQCAVTIDAKTLGIPDTAEIVDAYTGERVSQERRDGAIVVTLDIQPTETKVIRARL